MTEHAVVFPASESLVGVFTEAEAGSDGSRPAVVFLNAGLIHRIGPNRLWVRLARELAPRGFSSLRFDLSGVGDSSPRTDALPLRAAAVRDVHDALDFLSATRALSSFILVGLCSGADLAFRMALTDKRVIGAVLVDALPYRTGRSYVYQYASRVWRLVFGGLWREILAPDGPLGRNLPWSPKKPRKATARLGGRDIPPRDEAESGLRDLAERGVNLLVVYTEDGGYNYRRQFADMFPSVPTDHVQVEYIKGTNHLFTLLANQDRLVRIVGDWIARFR